MKEYLGRGSHSRISQEAATDSRTETAQYQFLSMLMNRASPFNPNQKQRLHEEFQIHIKKVRELYHDHTGKKNNSLDVSGNRNNIASNHSKTGDSSSANENAIQYLMDELERIREQNIKLSEANQSLIDLLREKDENLNRLIAKFINQNPSE